MIYTDQKTISQHGYSWSPSYCSPFYFFHTIDSLLPCYRISLLCLLSPVRKVPRDQESGFCSVMYSNFAEWCVSFSRCSIIAKWCSHYEEQYGGSSETKNRVATWSSNPTPRHISGQNYNSKRYMHPYVQSSTIYNSQDMETTSMSIDRWMDKEDVVYMYNRIWIHF